MIDDFNYYESVTDGLIDKYFNVLPNSLIEIWRNQGLGTFMNGYLKVINPDEFENVFNASYFRSDVSIPVLITAFGDIITWEKNKYVGIVRYRYGKSDIMISNFDLFLRLLKDDTFVKEYFNIKQYNEAVKAYGKLDYDECFGYVPLLGLGGKETVKNLKKVKVREHIELICEMVGGV